MERNSRDIFEGKALIDRLLVYFSKFEGSREKATKYAQKLLDLGHIECLDNSTTFEDSDLHYQWTDVARVVKQAKTKLVEHDALDNLSAMKTRKTHALDQPNSRKPVVRISIEADNCEGAEIRAHIRASPIGYPHVNDNTNGVTNNEGKFCQTKVENGKMISFVTETSTTTEEILRMVPVSSTVEKFEKLLTGDQILPVGIPRCLNKGNKYGDRNGTSDSKSTDVSIDNDGQSPLDSNDVGVVTSISPGQGETSSHSRNNCVNEDQHAIENSQHILQPSNDYSLKLGSRSKSVPTIPIQNYVFSEDKYLQDKLTAIPNKLKEPKLSNVRELATPNGNVSMTNVGIQNEQDSADASSNQSSETAEENRVFENAALLKLRQEYLESEDIRADNGYSVENHHTDMFDSADGAFLHSSCLPETIAEDPEYEDTEEMEQLKGIDVDARSKPLIHISPPPPSPPLLVKSNDHGLKPLFWTKISCKSDTSKEEDGVFWMNTDTNVKFDEEEFKKLFSKPRQAPPCRSIAKHGVRQHESSSGSMTLKVLGNERSRQIGIRASSFKLQPEDIHDAIINMDDTELDFDALDALYDVRPTSDELDDIADALRKYPDGILDKPEQFVLMMAMIGNLDERLKSWIFMRKFPDRVLDFKDQMKTLSNACLQVVKNCTLQRLLEATLVFGNFLNKGTQRGDADGYHLDILPKIKDVKSQGGDTNLMLFLVKWLIAEKENNSETLDLVQRRNSEGSAFSQSLEEDDCGLPNQASLLRACSTSLQELQEGIVELATELSECKEQLILAVIEGATCISEIKPFSERMKDFIEQAEEAVAELQQLSNDTAEVAEEFRRYYMPPEGQSDSCVTMLKYISTFCEDFRFYWENEKRTVAKEAFFSTEKARRQRMAAVKIVKSPSALKERFLQKRRRERVADDMISETPPLTYDSRQNGCHRRVMSIERTGDICKNDQRNVRQATPAIGAKHPNGVQAISSNAGNLNNPMTSVTTGDSDRSGSTPSTRSVSKMKEAMAKRRIMLKSKTS